MPKELHQVGAVLLPIPTEPQSEELPLCQCDNETQGSHTIQQLIVEDEEHGQPWGEEGQGTNHQAKLQGKFASTYPMCNLQNKDPTLPQVKRCLVTGNPPAIDVLTDALQQCYHCQYSELRLYDGVVYLKDGENFRTCVPETLIPDVFRLLHQHPLAGHLG